MYYPSYLRLIVSGYLIHFSIPPSILPYNNIPPPLPLITPSSYLSSHLLLHASLLSLVYTEQADPNIALIVTVLSSTALPDTSPWYYKSQCIVRPCFGGGQYTPRSHPSPLLPAPPQQHRWELPGNYPVFTVIMLIYHYIEKIWRILVTPNLFYNIYNHG